MPLLSDSHVEHHRLQREFGNEFWILFSLNTRKCSAVTPTDASQSNSEEKTCIFLNKTNTTKELNYRTSHLHRSASTFASHCGNHFAVWSARFMIKRYGSHVNWIALVTFLFGEIFMRNSSKPDCLHYQRRREWVREADVVASNPDKHLSGWTRNPFFPGAGAIILPYNF